MTAARAEAPRDGDWTPTDRQRSFLASSAYEALYGGAAGGGKSESLLVAPLRWVHHKSFRAILFRRTFPDLERSLIDRSRGLYSAAFPGAVYNDSKHVWRFPSGATISFGHCANERDVYGYQSAEFQFIGFDELTHFTKFQYTYMLSRARSSKGLPIRVRASTNPGGVGHEWVFDRWSRWLNPESLEAASPGQTLYYRNTEDGERWCEAHHPDALSRVFIPAKVADNPHIAVVDPQYIQRLMGLDAVTRAQLKDGNWLIKPGAGKYFKRGWFEIVDAAPVEAERIRYWDRAASVDGDWTAGPRLSRTHDGVYYVEDVVRFRGRPKEVRAQIFETATTDKAAHGDDLIVGIEKDPGQAGVSEAESYTELLDGFNVRVFTPSGDKITRAKAASAQVEAGNVKLVRGPWNEAFLQELEGFPDGDYDDQVDGFSGAFNNVPRHEVDTTTYRGRSKRR